MSKPSLLRLSRLQRLRARLLTWGPERATLAMTVLAAGLALLVSQTALVIAGLGVQPVPALASVLVAGLVSPVILWPLMQLWADAESARRQLDVLATRDDLTGAFNRRQFLVLADREWARCKRYDMSAALLMFDLDHFKRVNDLHGHLAGDLMLREMAQAVTRTLRQADLFGRFGGEEFIAFLPHTDTLGALDVAERIREAVAQLCLEWRGQEVRTTVSVGVVPLESGHESLGALIADADLALYAAKDAGRNCVRTAPVRLPTGRPNWAEIPKGHEGGPAGPWGTRTK